MTEIDNQCAAKYCIFESTQVSLNNEFLSFIPTSVDQSSFFIELAEELQLTFCEQIDNGCPVLLGLWNNILKAEKRLEECLYLWKEERAVERDKSPEADTLSITTEGNENLTQVNILVPDNQTALLVPADVQSVLPGGSHLYLVSSGTGQPQTSQLLHHKISSVKQNNNDKQGQRKEKLGQTQAVKELYVDIAVNSSRRKKNSQSFDLKIPTEQNPLDKLCQLLCIDEDETIEKRLCEAEKKRNYEEKLPYKYFCDKCSFKAKRENHLLKHAKLHDERRAVFCCNQCDFKTIRESVLCRHKIIHSATKLTCKLCPYDTDARASLLKHMQVRHGSNCARKVKCRYCEFNAATSREILRHTKLLHSKTEATKIWKCSKCQYKSRLRAHLNRHMNDVHGSLRQFLCHYCGKSFKRNDTLTLHKASHGEINRSYTCQHCGKVCITAVHLREHMASHTTERPFLCDICGKSYKTRQATLRHKRFIHSRSGPELSCPQCERTFKHKTHLNKHLKLRCRKSHRLKTEATVVPAVISGANVQQEVISTPITIQVVYTDPSNQQFSIK